MSAQSGPVSVGRGYVHGHAHEYVRLGALNAKPGRAFVSLKFVCWVPVASRREHVRWLLAELSEFKRTANKRTSVPVL
ncbi:hypothetical protein HaLaN_16371 [Haematococcus lacustris]|uniref:Uncharacterized protein n=1 Tax=Haematococcus lacustris TaxID=44745 RepID=A0A699ZCE7_HAELA|nr:hypothetical protein HaLaN_16371 [Haematococcus lacustris]